jgi:hypothetical protein
MNDAEDSQSWNTPEIRSRWRDTVRACTAQDEMAAGSREKKAGESPLRVH